ncbi:MAG TPA: putative porin [bacterium]|jgi:hypothetical protein
MKINRLPCIYLILIILLVCAFPSQANADDVPRDHWAYSAVEYLYEEGLAEGFPDGGFHGDSKMTRYEFAMVIARMYNNFMEKLEDQDSPPPAIEVESVLARLIDEFEPELDDLRSLVLENAQKIDSLESAIGDQNEMLVDIQGEISSMDNRFHTYGDIRLRFEGNYPEDGLQSHRPRYRFRWGFSSRITEELTLGTRFASGEPGSITSTNRTYDDAFAIDDIFLDRAYIRYQPDSIPGFSVWAGKFSPPFRTSPISWDSDVNIEGLAQHYNRDNLNFFLAELVPAEQGFYLVAQVGYTDLLTEGLDAAVTYHFINEDAWMHIMADMINGDLRNNFDFSRLESPTDYRAWEGYLRYSNMVSEVPWAIELSCVTNLEDSAVDNQSSWGRAGFAELSIGDSPSMPEDWLLTVEWGRTQANSVLSWLTEGDRGHGDHEWFGGTFTYRLLRNTDVKLTYVTLDRISNENDGFDLFQFNVMTKF